MKVGTLMVGAGALVPVLYFGVQAAALGCAPDYSVLRQTASELGMASVSSCSAFFNGGVIARGVLLWLVSVATYFTLRRGGVGRFGALWVAASLAAIGCNDVGAGLFPLPDARHEGAFLLGYVFWPPAVWVTLRAWPDARAVRSYVALSFALTWALFAWRVAAGTDFEWAGLFQRLLGVVTVVPLGVVSVFLARRAGIPR